MPVVIKANKREVPPDTPIGAWWERVQAYRSQNLEIPWYLPDLEYLSPSALDQIKAKARVWFEVTGEWPRDINCWGEIRRGRLNGNVPLRDDWALSYIDAEGVLHCSECVARCSQNSAGSYGRDGHPRCNLCGVQWMVRNGN